MTPIKATTLASLTLLLACGADTNRLRKTYTTTWDDQKKEYDYEFYYSSQDWSTGSNRTTATLAATLVTNVTTEVRTITLTNLMLQCITTNSGGVFTNYVPVMTIGTNVGERYICPPNRSAFFSTLQGLGTGVHSNGGAE